MDTHHTKAEPIIDRNSAADLGDRNVREALKESDRRLQRTVAQLEAIINALPGMVAVVDRSFTTLIANQAVIERFGNSKKSEVIGKKCHKVRKNLDDVCSQCGIARTFKTGEPYTRVSTPEEEKLMGIATKAYAIPLKDETGEIWGGVEVIMDVSDLRQKEQALRENEERFRTIIEQAADAVYVCDMQGRIVNANQKATDDTGYNREELLAKTVMDLDADHPTLEACVEKWTALDVGKSFQFESRHIHRDGSTFPVEINTSAIVIDGKKHILGFARDIRARKEAEEKLKHFKSAVESSTAAVGLSTPEGHHWYQNKVFDDLFGEIGSDPFTIFVDRELGREILRTITSGAEWTGEVEMYDKNKNILPVLLRSYAIKDNAGNVVGVVGVHTDLTERKQAEEERLRFEHQIHKSQKLESLGILAGGIAHDFNNLLAGLFGYIEMARHASSLEVVSSHLAKALGAMDRARGLTQQLLTFSKGGAPQKKILPLFPFVQETVEFALSGSSVFCEFEVQEDLWPCKYDKNQFGQVVNNIVINAKQAMPMGGRITVSAENVSLRDGEVLTLASDHYVKISIEDTGIGMPDSIISNIFDPFFTTKQLGSGLGLTTSYSIIHRHGGGIDVSSKPGKGSVFVIYIPATLDAAVSQDVESKRMHVGNGRILVMDDEEMIRESTKAMCSALGYEVVCEADGKAAVRRFAEARQSGLPFKAIILDLTVPGGMGGKEALLELRKIDSDVPIFVSSGYADDPVMANPTAYRFTGSLCKPFRQSDLTGLLEHHINKTGSGDKLLDTLTAQTHHSSAR